MRKFWKIFGISLGSILLVLLIVILVAIYIVFTPKHLTPIVRKVAANYIDCPYEIGEVDLTFFSTFPEFGLRIKNVKINGQELSNHSQNFLDVPELIATVDVRKFLKDNTLDIHRLELNDAQIHILQDSEGRWNFDVFKLPPSEEDTTATKLPFQHLKVDKVDLHLRNLTVEMQRDSVFAELNNTRLQASARSWQDIDLSLGIQSLTATIGNETYANNMPLLLSIKHAGFDFNNTHLRLPQASLQADNYLLNVMGEVKAKDDLYVDLQVLAKDWELMPLLKMLPQSIIDYMDDIVLTQGELSLLAHAKGYIKENTLPLIDAQVTLSNSAGSWKSVLPYDFSSVELQASSLLNFNDSTPIDIHVNYLNLSLPKDLSLHLDGDVQNITGDMYCDVRLAVAGQLKELDPFFDFIELPFHGTGEVDFYADIKSPWDELSELYLMNSDVRGALNFKHLDADYDSLFFKTPQLDWTFRFPNKGAKMPTADWMNADLRVADLEFNGLGVQASLQPSTWHLEVSDLMVSDPVTYVNVVLQTPELVMEMDSIQGVAQHVNLATQIEYNSAHDAPLPVIKAHLNFADLQAYMPDIQAHLKESKLSASLQGRRRDNKQPSLEASIETQALQAVVGQDMAFTTDRLSLNAKARYKPEEENILLQWNPKLSVQLNNGVAQLADFPETVYIPSIDFDYSNRLVDIRTSQIQLGKSDFALEGQVENIGKWLRHKDILKGELLFKSRHTEVNELMNLFSADKGSEEEEEEASQEMLPEQNVEVAALDNQEAEESKPFLVPKDVDLTLTTEIDEAIAFDQIARDLTGRVYVRNGALVLEEMGFICRAARLQLTAIYKTPRVNHLYLGMDYHMLDIQIDELVNMIPQVDSILPMLRSFQGNAEFHLAAETYLKSNYDIKWSTTRGACSITGKDLVLLDNETFGKIAKLLMFNKKTENIVDSINAEVTLFRKEVDVYPFCLTIDNYMAAVGGRHNLDMTFDYDINVLKPIYLGVHVGGTFDDLDIRLAKCKYAQDFRPLWRREVDTFNANLKKVILESMQRNVKQ